mmetsp:Transcript_45615/g.145557  ORF Transcript_45615/g.145557 Transcript_45615/m.145557 type:complete len:287 (+) Transcript_45615:620-1480(+)
MAASAVSRSCCGTVAWTQLTYHGLMLGTLRPSLSPNGAAILPSLTLSKHPWTVPRAAEALGSLGPAVLGMAAWPRDPDRHLRWPDHVPSQTRQRHHQHPARPGCQRPAASRAAAASGTAAATPREVAARWTLAPAAGMSHGKPGGQQLATSRFTTAVGPGRPAAAAQARRCLPWSRSKGRHHWRPGHCQLKHSGSRGGQTTRRPGTWPARRICARRRGRRPFHVRPGPWLAAHAASGRWSRPPPTTGRRQRSCAGHGSRPRGSRKRWLARRVARRRWGAQAARSCA